MSLSFFSLPIVCNDSHADGEGLFEDDIQTLTFELCLFIRGRMAPPPFVVPPSAQAAGTQAAGFILITPSTAQHDA